jgi:hypothetical protein
MNTPAAEKSTHANERFRHDSHIPPSPDYRKEKFSAEPMSRGSSWDRHSGTASFNDKQMTASSQNLTATVAEEATNPTSSTTHQS